MGDMKKYEPGTRVTYTDEAKQAWIDAQVFQPLPTGDGTVIATPRPYLSVPGLVYIAWDSQPNKWTLTDQRALQVVTPELLAERPMSLADVYFHMRLQFAGVPGFEDETLAAKLGHDYARLTAAGIDPNQKFDTQMWDANQWKYRLYLGQEGLPE